MNERAAQMILLVRAFEEADREGLVLPLEQRTAATRRAIIVTTREEGEGEFSRDVLVPSEETLLRRARLLYNGLNRRIPAIERVLDFSRLRSAMGPAIMIAAFAIGVATNALGGRQVNLIALPLIGLLLWNGLAYLGMSLFSLIRPWLVRTRKIWDPSGQSLVTGLADGVVRFALWRGRWRWTRRSRAPRAQQRIIARAFTRYCALWHRLTRGLLEARVRRRLHLAALALCAGVVAGMYVRGIAFEYRATWESTLLSPAAMQNLLNLLLGPAALLLGTSVPDVAPLQAPGDGPAAIWIHLYAVTALLWVGLPRSILAGVEAWKGYRIKERTSIDVGDGYYRRLLADWRGGTKRVAILPYSYRPAQRTQDVIKALLRDFLGTRADIDTRTAMAYGDVVAEQAMLFDDNVAVEETAPSTLDRYVVAMFNLAQTPEVEVHAAFLESLKLAVDDRRGRLLVLIDTTEYQKSQRPDRVQERLRAWERVVGDAGLIAVDLDPTTAVQDHRAADERMARFREAFWPDRATREQRLERDAD